MNLLYSLHLSTPLPHNPFIPVRELSHWSLWDFKDTTARVLQAGACKQVQTRCHYSKWLFPASICRQPRTWKFLHSVNLFTVISVQEPRRKRNLCYNQILACMAVFCVFFAVFSYSFSASTSYRTAVIERKTYTFHEPSNMLVFLQINNSLLLGAICFLLLSLRGAYHNTLLCQKQNILVYCLARYLLTASVVVCFTRCVAALAHSCCGMGHWQGCTPTTKATTERFSNFWRAVFNELPCHLFLGERGVWRGDAGS